MTTLEEVLNHIIILTRQQVIKRHPMTIGQIYFGRESMNLFELSKRNPSSNEDASFFFSSMIINSTKYKFDSTKIIISKGMKVPIFPSMQKQTKLAAEQITIIKQNMTLKGYIMFLFKLLSKLKFYKLEKVLLVREKNY